MSETASPAQASPPQEADIASALGRRSIVLVGMMGAGKSTIGRRLGARLRLRQRLPIRQLGNPFVTGELGIDWDIAR